MASSKPVPARRGEVASARNSARSKESERTTATACRRKARQISFEFPCAAEYVKQCGIDNWEKNPVLSTGRTCLPHRGFAADPDSRLLTADSSVHARGAAPIDQNTVARLCPTNGYY